MKKAALAALLATTVIFAPWRVAEATNFLHGQRLYSLGDYPGAMIIWRDLALRGDARAQYSLAVMYQKGHGVTLDKVKAREWARRAADQNYEPGRRLFEQLQAGAKIAGGNKPRKPAGQLSELERTKAAVEELLARIGGKIARDGALHHGQLQAEKLDDAIQITIPDIMIQSSDGGAFELGDVLARVRHVDQRYDDITLALPGEIRFRNSDGTSGRITIANRLANLRWDRRVETSTEFEFRFGQIIFLSDDNGELGRIAEILAQAQVVEAQELWTGPMAFSLTGLNMTNFEQARLSVDSARVDLDLRDLDLHAYARNSASPGWNGTAGTAAMPPLETLLTMASGLGLRTRIAGLSWQSPTQGAFQLAAADYGVSLSSPDRKLLNLTLTARHDGLSGTGSAAPEAMVPRKMNVALNLSNLPIDTLVSVGVAAAVEVMLLGQVTSGQEVFNRLRRELSAAATVLRLKRADVAAQDYNIAFDFTLRADGAAKAGVVGGGNLRITDLKNILDAFGIGEQPPLAALSKMGRPVTGGPGVSFAIAVRPDGQLTINGDAFTSLAPFQK